MIAHTHTPLTKTKNNRHRRQSTLMTLIRFICVVVCVPSLAVLLIIPVEKVEGWIIVSTPLSTSSSSLALPSSSSSIVSSIPRYYNYHHYRGRRTQQLYKSKKDSDEEYQGSDLSSSSSSASSSLPLPTVWTLVDSKKKKKHGSSDNDSTSWKQVQIDRAEVSDTTSTNDDKASSSSSSSSTNKDNYSRTSIIIQTAAMETWNWCHRFVVQHKLCPWAQLSVETANALQIYVVVTNKTDTTTTSNNNNNGRKEENDLSSSLSADEKFDILCDVGRRFEDLIQVRPTLEPYAIFFCVFLEHSKEGTTPVDDQQLSFLDFYNEFFDEIEQRWLKKKDENNYNNDDEDGEEEEDDTIILAPFHPDWTYGSGGDDASLAFEKRSPHPTISLVSARVIDQAGSRATEQIGIQNEETLLDQSAKQWQILWDDACRAEQQK